LPVEEGLAALDESMFGQLGETKASEKPSFILSSKMLERASLPCTFAPITERQLDFTSALAFYAV